MNLLILNPNNSEAMTAQVLEAARCWAPTNAVLRGTTAAQGPPVIASRESFAAGACAARALWPAQDDGWADVVLLACFGDPGLAELRRDSRVPVIGMAEAALTEAAQLGRPFHIITAGRAWDAMLRETIAQHPAAAPLLHGITVLEGTGLAMAQDPTSYIAHLQGTLHALQQSGAPTCILGGAGFARLSSQLQYAGALLDGISAGVRAAQNCESKAPQLPMQGLLHGLVP